MKSATRTASRKTSTNGSATRKLKRSRPFDLRNFIPHESTIEESPVFPPVPERLTVVEVKLDVGFGNQIFIRGTGAGLSWEQGTLLTCVDGQTWRWMAIGAEPVAFKLLLNDEVWAQGTNVEAQPGDKLELMPVF